VAVLVALQMLDIQQKVKTVQIQFFLLLPLQVVVEVVL
tara:strand:- start:532 stop:645 length:114 start_codon:yes stop_codon:yes gene_type:complete